MPGFRGTSHAMPQFPNKKGGPKQLPDVPFNDLPVSGGGSSTPTKASSSMTGYTSRATVKGVKMTGAQ